MGPFESDATLLDGHGPLLKIDHASALMNFVEVKGAY
jgi:hypothetical protein